VFFGVEVILREFSIDALFTVMLAAMIADITAIPFLGGKPFLSGFPPGIELHHARMENLRAWVRYPTARAPDRCERACCSSLCRIEGNLAVVGNEYMVSKHRGGRAPPTRFRVAGGKGIR